MIRTTVALSSVVALSAVALFGFTATNSVVAPAPVVAQAAKIRIGVSIPSADHGWTAGVVYWAKQCAS
ncbi:MAG: hypothetical protein DWI12_12015, partial [Planctomycetota bacterium]